MLAITQTAADALDTIADSASAPETGGVRIAHSARADGAVDLSLTLVDSPEPTDQVLESAGHPLFIEAPGRFRAGRAGGLTDAGRRAGVAGQRPRNGLAR